MCQALIIYQVLHNRNEAVRITEASTSIVSVPCSVHVAAAGAAPDAASFSVILQKGVSAHFPTVYEVRERELGQSARSSEKRE
jgi:succinyl-CoA synthetase alpha subunit